MSIVKGGHLLARRRPRVLLKEFVPSIPEPKESFPVLDRGLKRKADTDTEVFAGNTQAAKRKKQILELFAAKVD